MFGDQGRMNDRECGCFGEKEGLRGSRPRWVQMCVSHSVIHASVGAACPSRLVPSDSKILQILLCGHSQILVDGV